MTKKAETAKSFEEMLQRLEEIVRALEKGEEPLDQSLALYTEGAELIRACTGKLDAAEQTVVCLRKGAEGEPVEIPFEAKEE